MALPYIIDAEYQGSDLICMDRAYHISITLQGGYYEITSV